MRDFAVPERAFRRRRLDARTHTLGAGDKLRSLVNSGLDTPRCRGVPMRVGRMEQTWTAAARRLLALPLNHALLLPSRRVNVPITSLATCLCRALGIWSFRSRLPSRMRVAKPCTIAQQAVAISRLTLAGWLAKA